MIEVKEKMETENARIMVIGVGGGGNNAVNSMIEDGVAGVTYVCLNTDVQALDRCKASNCLQIGVQLTKGLGAGADPEVGEKAAIESEEEIKELLNGQDMVIVTCGMGGGTGTGGAPVVARIARAMGILTVGVVTKPFMFEARTRMKNALSGIERLSEFTDTLIVISNNKLLEIVDRKTTMPEALKKSDMILKQTIQGITDLINRPAMINLDFADVTTIMKDKGIAYIGIGTGNGENRTIEAVENALHSPLLETGIDGATNVLLNISGDVTLWDANDGAEKVREMASEDANIIFGAMFDDSVKDTVTVTVIATGVEKKSETSQQASAKEPEKDFTTSRPFAFQQPPATEVQKEELPLERSEQPMPELNVRPIHSVGVPTEGVVTPFPNAYGNRLNGEQEGRRRAFEPQTNTYQKKQDMIQTMNINRKTLIEEEEEEESWGAKHSEKSEKKGGFFDRFKRR